MICVTQHWSLIKCSAPIAVLAAFLQIGWGAVHASTPVSLDIPGITSNAYSNAFERLTCVGLLTLLLPGLFTTDLCFASVGLLILACVCRLVKWEAKWAPGHPLAGSSEMRPADERHSPMQQPQAGHPVAGSSEKRPAEESQPSLQRPNLACKFHTCKLRPRYTDWFVPCFHSHLLL